MANKVDVPDLPDLSIPKVIEYSRRDDKIVDAAVEIEEQENQQENQDTDNLGFTTRMMTLAGLPHQDPKKPTFTRINGNFQMRLTDLDNKGLPFGIIPRLILTWITTETTTTKSKQLTLGRSLPKFLKKLDIQKSGGEFGTTTRVLDQMERLFNCAISVKHTQHEENRTKTSGQHRLIVHDYLLWESLQTDNNKLWNATIILSQPFFDEIQSRPIPICLRTLRAIRQSPLAIDIYLWLTYRNCYLKKETTITWPQLHAQFGSNYRSSKKGLDNFRTAFLRELNKVTTIYKDAQYRVKRGRFILIPSMTSIKRTHALIDERDERIKPARCTNTKDMFE